MNNFFKLNIISLGGGHGRQCDPLRMSEQSRIHDRSLLTIGAKRFCDQLLPKHQSKVEVTTIS
jgi:hypothetical protein